MDPEIQVISEPGRYYVDSAFTVVAQVLGKKVIQEEDTKRFMYYMNDGTC